MKAGVTAAAAATVAIHRSGAQLRGDLLFTGVVGELQGGVGVYDLVQRGIGCDYTIICEPSFLDVRTMHSGACQYVITVTGSSAWIGMLHRSEYVNAVNVMADVVKALDNVEFSAQPHDATPGLPAMIVGGINGGIGTDFLKWRASYVPDYCATIVEVRGVPGQDWEQTQADIDRVLDGVRAANPNATIEIAPPPATYTEGLAQHEGARPRHRHTDGSHASTDGCAQAHGGSGNRAGARRHAGPRLIRVDRRRLVRARRLRAYYLRPHVQHRAHHSYRQCPYGSPRSGAYHPGHLWLTRPRPALDR